MINAFQILKDVVDLTAHLHNTFEAKNNAYYHYNGMVAYAYSIGHLSVSESQNLQTYILIALGIELEKASPAISLVVDNTKEKKDE